MKNPKAVQLLKLSLVLSLLLSGLVGLVPGVSAAPTELFFSEYIEGSSYNKALEIYNGTGAEITFTGQYVVSLYSNGNASPNASVVLTGTVADGDVFVLAHPSASASVLAEADQTSGSAINFNGDDAIALSKDGVLIDVIGQIGTDPGSYWGSGDITTQNHTLRRLAAIEAGDPDGSDAFDPTLEWEGFASDTFDGLGSHSTAEPATAIATARGMQGEIVTIEGRATAPTGIFYAGSGNAKFYIQDASGGIQVQCFGSNGTLPEVTLGDLVRVTGVVGEYNDEVQIVPDDNVAGVVVSDGDPSDVPAPTSYALSAIGESTEGWLVEVSGSLKEVGTPDSYGNQDIVLTDGTTDLAIRIDGNAGLDTSALAVDDDYTISGIAGQYYATYQVLPRIQADLVESEPPADYTGIDEIQYTVDPSGDSPLAGDVVTTTGVVYAVYDSGFCIADDSGPWHGIYVYYPDSDKPVIGDAVEVVGTVIEYYGLTELGDYASYSVLSSGNSPYSASSVTAADIAFDNAASEAYEGVFVEVQAPYVTAEADSHGVWGFSDASGGTGQADDWGFHAEPSVGESFSLLRGALIYDWNAYKVMPRTEDDLVTLPNLVITEIMQNPSAVSDNDGEWFEIYNAGDTAVDLSDWMVQDAGSDSFTIAGPLSIAPGAYMVFGKNGDSATNGGLVVDYVYPGNWYLANGDDEVLLLDAGGTLIDEAWYDGGTDWPDPTGASMMLKDVALDNNVGANWQTTPAGLSYGLGDLGTPGCPNTGCPVDYTPIYDIQYTTDAYGDSPYDGQSGITTQGIVVAVFYGGYFIEDPAGGAWNGLYVYDSTQTPAIGDYIRIEGEIDEYYNLTEIKNLTSYELLSSGNPLPAAVVLTTIAVSQEQWESVLVRVENVSVTNPSLGYGEWSVSDGSGDVVIDDRGSYTYAPTSGALIDFIVGPVDYGFGAYKIQPRDDDDIGPYLPPAISLTIPEIQGTDFTSPYEGVRVETTGIVIGLFEGNLPSGGGNYDGFYIQTPTGDGDPATSDGIFVNIGSGTPSVNIGDNVTVVGTVVEFNEYGDPAPATETHINASIADIETNGTGSVNATALAPDGSMLYFEALEGMLVELPAEAYPAPVVGPTSYGTFFVVRGDEGVSRVLRNTPQEGKTFGARSYVRYGDGTPDLIVGSTANTGIAGPLAYSYGNYLVALQDIKTLAVTAVAPPQVPPSWPEALGDELTVASFNTYNFDNTGTALSKVAENIKALGGPLMIGLQEIDVDTVMSGLLAELAAAGYTYDYAYSHPDVGGHGVAVLWRTDRVSNVTWSTDYQACSAVGSSSSTYDPLWDTCQASGLYPLFSRRPVVVNAQISVAGTSAEVTMIGNHFKSKLGGAEADQRRLEQAQLVASLVDDLIAVNPQANIVVVGDLNDFEDSAPLQALYASGNLSSLWYTLNADARYSYIYNGTSQILDHILVSPQLLSRLQQMSPVHTNADYPYNPWASDASVVWRASDHDPVASTFTFVPPTAAFTPSATNVYVDENVSFTNTSTGDAPLASLWDFGDGNTSNETSPAYQWTEPGLYTVTLTVSNDLGSDSSSVTISVRPRTVPFGAYSISRATVHWLGREGDEGQIRIDGEFTLPEGYTQQDLEMNLGLVLGINGETLEASVPLEVQNQHWRYQKAPIHPEAGLDLYHIKITWDRSEDPTTATFSVRGRFKQAGVDYLTDPATIDSTLVFSVIGDTLAESIVGEQNLAFTLKGRNWK